MTPIVGIAACMRPIKGMAHHVTPAVYAEAVLGGAGALPVMLPPMGEAMLALLDRLDGLLLSGSPSNVAPALYGMAHDATPDEHDLLRDATTLPLIREAVARGMPVLAICRGVQELNVALGGSLHQEVHGVDGRMDHRSDVGTLDERFGPRHPVSLEGGLARLVGASELQVNSLHGQALDRVAGGLVVEARAADGTVEAVRLEGMRGWGYGLQWHPEWRYAENPASVAIFAAFGNACRDYAAGRVSLGKAA
jgi:putative glutamine amidotransferase